MHDPGGRIPVRDCIAKKECLPSFCTMFAKLHKFLAVLAVFGMVCAPVFAGKVACSTDNGHFAIEAAHDLTGCPETAADHAPVDDTPEKSQPCDDRDLVGDLVSQSKTGCASIDATCLTLSLIPASLSVPDCALFLSLRVPPPRSQPPPADHDRLASVILLI